MTLLGIGFYVVVQGEQPKCREMIFGTGDRVRCILDGSWSRINAHPTGVLSCTLADQSSLAPSCCCLVPQRHPAAAASPETLHLQSGRTALKTMDSIELGDELLRLREDHVATHGWIRFHQPPTKQERQDRSSRTSASGSGRSRWIHRCRAPDDADRSGGRVGTAGGGPRPR